MHIQRCEFHGFFFRETFRRWTLVLDARRFLKLPQLSLEALNIFAHLDCVTVSGEVSFVFQV